jgi:N utilization substance protein B
MKSRTKARGIALQALYEIDITGHSPPRVLEERLLDTPVDNELAVFISQIVMGVSSVVQPLDNLIAQHASEWPLDQVAIIDRNILRIALWEFAVQGITPLKVAINEAIVS